MPLRLAAESLIPKRLAWAPKGIARLRHDDLLWEVISMLVKSKVTTERVMARGLLDIASVKDLIVLPARRKRTMHWLYRLWYLVALETWCELFIDRQGAVN
ncbi:MAG: hypothetical protein CBARDMAM_5157 [uncultured Caballeronia sp.]|nr:MAG: hypothetical protein CBARDMAM_5157 [uncultured Caballeronia sp.]